MYTTNKMSWLNAGEGSCDIVTRNQLHYEPLTYSGEVNDFRFNIIIDIDRLRENQPWISSFVDLLS